LTSETFLSTDDAIRQEATLMTLEDAADGGLLLLIAINTTRWEGSSAELLDPLKKLVAKKVAASVRSAKTASQLSRELRRAAPLLYMRGLSIQFSRNRDKRLIVISKFQVPIIPSSHATPMPVML